MSTTMKCRNCSAEITVGSHFCTRCGADQAGTITATDAAPDPRIGITLEDKYRIDSTIGAGGMATVYRATRLLIGDSVAVKILHQDQLHDRQAPERFRREAQAAARLKHPNAVSIYDFGVSNDGMVYLVMELVDGESLRHLLKEHGPLLPSAAAEIIIQVCAALDDAHRQQVVHRDIKPDNIIVFMTETGPRVKVLDFGIARLRDMTTVGNLTQTGSVMGTPHYMSPEQCLGEELDGRSDIYSLGIVLYEMLSGVVPFNSPTAMAVVVQHVNTVPASLRILNVSVPPAVEAVVMRALEKRREARQQTAAALAAEFSAAANGTMTTSASLAAGGTTTAAAPASTILMQTPWSTRTADSLTSPTDGVLAGAEHDVQPRKHPASLLLGAAAVMIVASAAVGLFVTSRKSGPPTDARTAPDPPPATVSAVVTPAQQTPAKPQGPTVAPPPPPHIEPLPNSGEATQTRPQELASEGGLTIRTVAGSTVQLDGVAVGTANNDGSLILSSVAAGRHVLAVHKDHYADVQQTIAVVAGQEDPIEIRLQPQHGTDFGTVQGPTNPGGDHQTRPEAAARKPQIIDLSADRQEVEPNQPITLRVSASDLNADLLKFAWTTTAGSIEGRETIATLKLGPAAAQQVSSVTVTVTARNSRGLEAYKDIVLKLKRPEASVANGAMRRALSIGSNIEVWLESSSSSRGAPSGTVETDLETVEGVWQITSVQGGFPGAPITITPECRNCEFLGIVENPSTANGFMRIRFRVKPVSLHQPVGVLLQYQTQAPAKKK